MADANWSSQLHTALEEWSSGRLDRAGRSLHRVLEDCQSEDMAVWRAFLHNQLALLGQETGQWEEARHQWELALQSWSASGLQPGSPQLGATLDWYADILEHYQFGERARSLKLQHQSRRPPLLDPWQTEASGPQPGPVSAPAKAAQTGESYAPMGGKSVSTQRDSRVTGSWDELITQALELSNRANFARAQHLFDQARHQVVDQRVTHPHLLSLVYSAESIGAFLSGQYPQAEKARDQAKDLWRTPDSDREDLQKFAQALKSAGQDSAAVLFMSRVAQRQFPLLDPATDLQAGLARGDWQAPQKVDWLPRLEDSLKHYARGNLHECQRLLDNAALQLEADPAREALLGNLQALLAHAQGQESEARTFYNRARTRWTHANTLDAELQMLRRHKLEKVADALRAGHLLDPFEVPLPTQLGTALPPARPRLEEQPEAVEAPARSHHWMTWVLVAILGLLGVGAWRLSHPPATPAPTTTAHPHM